MDRRLGLIPATLLLAVAWGVSTGTAAQKSVKPTYSSDVAPIVDKNCVQCHRTGGIAPFSLESYEQVKKFGPMIKQVVKSGTMPPWFAKDDPAKPSPWANDRSMSSTDKAKVAQWVDGGMAAGTKRLASAAHKLDPTWQIGKPDAIYTMATPFELPADGVVQYQYFNVPMDSSEERYVEAVEVRPGNRSVVHHVLVFVEPNSSVKRPRGLTSLIDYFAIYVPGQGAVVYPKGYGRILPKDHHLRFQIHYTTNGKPSKDQTSVAFRFSKEKPKNVVKTASLVNFMFSIPPGAPNHPVQAKITLPVDMTVVSFLPHMHVRGKAARYEMTLPSGEHKMLLDVPRYDFNWQIQYDLKEPLVIPKGTKVQYTCWFDNSPENPSNPNPKKAVGWGDQTFEEMVVGYVVYVTPNS